MSPDRLLAQGPLPRNMGVTRAFWPGEVIFLNGASSSGKSTIASALLESLDRPYFLFSIDAVNAMRSRRQTARLSPDGVERVLTCTRAGFHRAFSGMVRGGNDVIVDYVLSEGWRLRDCLRVTEGLTLWFVGVHCDPAELARREQARDRPAGLALRQLPQVHAHRLYDIECDTTDTPAEECAHDIIRTMQSLTEPHAFTTLRQTLRVGTGPARTDH